MMPGMANPSPNTQAAAFMALVATWTGLEFHTEKNELQVSFPMELQITDPLTDTKVPVFMKACFPWG